MPAPGTSGYRKPTPHRRTERRGGRATAQLHDALNGPSRGDVVLSSDALRLARERRDRHATRNELPAWLASRTGRLTVGLVTVVVMLGISAVMIGAVVSILMGGR
ncbi:MAG: hypothetical protein AAF791_12420 [Bacteroidota bacterium]